MSSVAPEHKVCRCGLAFEQRKGYQGVEGWCPNCDAIQSRQYVHDEHTMGKERRKTPSDHRYNATVNFQAEKWYSNSATAKVREEMKKYGKGL